MSRPTGSAALDTGAARREPRTLADASHGHDNNLNLLRVLAALAVLLSHCYTLATGNSAREPARTLTGLSLGDMAVDVFFVVSGFLVTKSLVRSGSLRKYAAARALRILPGLWVALAVTTLVVCAFFSDFPFGRNLLDPATWRYLLQNGIPVTTADFDLPGAFARNPFPGQVNASLWTLPVEVWMYIVLAMLWSLATWARRLLHRVGFGGLVTGLAVLLVLGTTVLTFAGHPSNSLRHAASFFLAAGLFGLRARVALTAGRFVAASAAIVVAVPLPHPVFELTYRLLLPYIVLYAAFVPGGVVRRYNAVGDYSYGIYIYAFPIQQMVAAALPGVTPAAMFAVAGGATLLCAVASWHLVEKSALALRARLEGRPMTPTGA